MITKRKSTYKLELDDISSFHIEIDPNRLETNRQVYISSGFISVENLRLLSGEIEQLVREYDDKDNN